MTPRFEVGPHLDALIAEKIMGYANVRQAFTLAFALASHPHLERGEVLLGNEDRDAVRWQLVGEKRDKVWAIPPYSASITAAWEVAEKLRLTVAPVKVYDDEDEDEGTAYDGWGAAAISPWSRGLTEVDAPWGAEEYFGRFLVRPTAPHAICIAALVAVGIDPWEKPDA